MLEWKKWSINDRWHLYTPSQACYYLCRHWNRACAISLKVRKSSLLCFIPIELVPVRSDLIAGSISRVRGHFDDGSWIAWNPLDLAKWKIFLLWVTQVLFNCPCGVVLLCPACQCEVPQADTVPLAWKEGKSLDIFTILLEIVDGAIYCQYIGITTKFCSQGFLQLPSLSWIGPRYVMVRSTYGALFPIEYKFQGAIIAFTPARVLYTLRLAKNLRQVYVSPFLTTRATGKSPLNFSWGRQLDQGWQVCMYCSSNSVRWLWFGMIDRWLWT